MNVRTRVAVGSAVAEAPAAARFSLRIAPADLPAADVAFGLEFPRRIGSRRVEREREASMLGPDEWLLHAPEGEAEAVAAAFAAVEAPHSLVEIGDRETALRIEGPQAATLLAFGCPLDLEAIPPGASRRTVFDGVQIVLTREGQELWRLACWRSFAPHVRAVLAEAEAELAAGL